MSEQLARTAALLADGEMPPGWQLVASSVNARVAANRDEGIFYKEFLPRNPLEILKAWVRGSRATRAREHNDRLREAGFNAPVNLAWGALPGGREYLFSTAVAGQGVIAWLRGDLATRSGEQLLLRRQLLAQLGTFIGRLHAAGFTHGDLRTSNVLAQLEDGAFSFSLIDNERNVFRQPAAGRDMLRNLMQLNMLLPADVSARDRMRFFRRWREQLPGLSDEEARLLGIEAWRWAMRRLRAKGKL